MSRSVKIIISVAYFLMVTLGLFNLFVLSPAKNIEEIKTKPSMEIKHRTSYGPIDIYFFYDANEVLMVNNQEPGMKEAIPPGTYISTLYYYIHPYTHKLTLAAVNRDGHLICAGEEGVGWYLFDRRSDAGRKLLVRYSIPRVIATPDE